MPLFRCRARRKTRRRRHVLEQYLRISRAHIFMWHRLFGGSLPDNLFISGEAEKNLSPFHKVPFRASDINDYINFLLAGALFLSLPFMKCDEYNFSVLLVPCLLFLPTTWWKWRISKWTAFSPPSAREWNEGLASSSSCHQHRLHKIAITHKILLFRSRSDIYFFIKYITLLRAYSST